MHSAFDAFAPAYDVEFTDTALGRLLRGRVWGVLAEQLRPGQRVIEIACGTGEDAVWLAQRGVWVTATDGSPQMLQAAKRKAEAAGVSERVAFLLLDIAASENGDSMLDGEAVNAPFDGALSDFGGLNVIDNWRPLAQRLAELVRPGGWVILVPMGPVCPWEIAWHLAHLDLQTAFRRFYGPADALIGAAHIPVFYPSAGRLSQDFAPWFRIEEVQSLGFWLPPSYLSHLVDRFPTLFARLTRLESRTARLTRGLGDHYILRLRRSEGNR